MFMIIIVLIIIIIIIIIIIARSRGGHYKYAPAMRSVGSISVAVQVLKLVSPEFSHVCSNGYVCSCQDSRCE